MEYNQENGRNLRKFLQKRNLQHKRFRLVYRSPKSGLKYAWNCQTGANKLISAIAGLAECGRHSLFDTSSLPSCQHNAPPSQRLENSHQGCLSASLVPDSQMGTLQCRRQQAKQAEKEETVRRRGNRQRGGNEGTGKREAGEERKKGEN